MKIENDGITLRVSGIPELNAINARGFRDEVRAAITPSLACLEVDMSETLFVDDSGLGAFFAIFKIATTANKGVVLRILNPRPAIQELFELTQLNQLFEIQKR